MGSRKLVRKALAVVAAVAGLGLAASSDTGFANPPDTSFGAIKFHQGPTNRKITVTRRQIQDHKGSPFASWVGYSTFPEFTAVQKRMIQQAKSGGGTAAKGGKPSTGGGGSGSGTATIPYWEAPITSPLDGQTYTMSMVGSSPMAATPQSTTITYVPIVLRATVGNHTYDPTQPACDDTVPVATRFFNSPLFQNTSFNSNGVAITDQLASAFQRASFWSYVGGKTYGVKLAPSTTTPIVVDVKLRGQTYNVTCSNGTATTLAAVSINTFDSAIQSVIAQYATPTQLPIVLSYNIVESQNGQCCILGYHNAIPVSGGVQTYATGAYVDSGIFTGTQDISVWSHEIAEWLDDPFVQASVAGGGSDDLTPAWGNIGQVSGCQNNLEVGDPLSGTSSAISSSGGFTYHTQDLAYYDWFYRTPSHGTGGKYSFLGNFTSGQSSVCS